MLHSGFPSSTPSVPQITRQDLVKRVYLTSLLHDLGFSQHEDFTTHPAHHMSFELSGAILAFEHLRATYNRSPHQHHQQQLDSEQISDITRSIMLHGLPIDAGMSSPVGVLIQISAMFDTLGYSAYDGVAMSMLHRETVKEIEEAFPRIDLVKELVAGLPQMLKFQPTCLLACLPDTAGRLLKVVQRTADSE
ncbi:hypothetical protein BT96DRAFT_1000647 [Gymnopus androsaceus JB14]|uniref:HD domain-containing protein n=1 Tax=Gymnopus androsaceus JB14 TaxID=1447944 RepID=A0A6A4H488_9AGAR|nr:hypothetical protein BT96DRAFT_1000647 [Gymnopus androsaceus JB14]